MKLIIYYENLKQELEVDTNEMWSCLKLTSDKDLSDEEREKMIQDKVNKDWNNDEYNNWHRFNRHQIKKRDDLFDSNGEEIDAINLIPDDRDYILEMIDKEDTCKTIRKVLKKHKEWAEIVIAVVLDGYTIADYAKKIGKERTNVAHKYSKAIKILEKYYKKSHKTPIPVVIK